MSSTRDSDRSKSTGFDENPGGRSSNWLEATSRSIAARIPEAEGCSAYVAERLSALLLERLPRDVGEELLRLLPDPERERADALWRCIGDENASIGFPDFVDRALHAIGCIRRVEPDLLEHLSRRAAEDFLWAVASGIPLDLKQRIADTLPLELRSRMNLYTGHDESAKVA